MRKVLKVKEYVEASKGQFIPLEYDKTENSKAIKKVERIKDGEIFSKHTDMLVLGNWRSVSGLDMNVRISISEFFVDYINVMLFITIYSDSDDGDGSFESFELRFEKLEINQINPCHLHVIMMDSIDWFESKQKVTS